VSLAKRLVCLLALAAPGAAQPAQPPPLAAERDRILALAADSLAAGDTAQAVRLLQSAADRFESVQALVQLTRVQSTRQDAAGALESLRRALAIAPNSEEVRSTYAQLCLVVRLPLPAILALEPLTRMYATVPQYHYLLGVALMQVGNTPAAVEALQHAQRLEPNRPLTLVALGLALNSQKLYAEAKPYLLRSLELEPDNVDAVAALAECEDGLGELEQAEAHAQRALARAAENATANLVMGLLRMKQERYAEARDALEKVVAAEPTLPKAHYQLSLAYARLNDEASSSKHRELYQKVLKEAEQRLLELGRQTGLSSGGLRP
jgi:tetratricopeptide (TPR) repeat protein